MENVRSSGVLLHITSLPNRYGLGAISVEAYDFVRLLAKAKVKYWQILPHNHCDYGECPYNCYSVFAGNPYYIDLREFLSEGELAQFGIVPKTTLKVDTKKMQANLFNAFWYFYDKFRSKFDIEVFKKENAHWIYNYARFMSIKQVYGNMPWWEFPHGLDKCTPSACKKFDEQYGKVLDFYVFLQYIFFMQWTRLKDYANSLGVKIIGDLAIYSAMDGAEVWANREQYQFGEDGNPVVVSGCPPDAFSEEGQFWNQPVYDYKKMAKDGYTWWVDRMKIASKILDTIRIDHFRGFAQYWAIPYGAKSAKEGHWEKGPGIKLFEKFKENVKLEIFAEDLGVITDDVIRLKERAKLAGIKVFQFAYESDLSRNYLPHNYEKHCVAYIGTHDNDTMKGFLESCPEWKLELFSRYLRVPSDNIDEMVDRAIMLLFESHANTCVVCMQDLLKLGTEGRMNVPGVIEGNWQYQLETMPGEELVKRLYELNDIYQRM